MRPSPTLRRPRLAPLVWLLPVFLGLFGLGGGAAPDTLVAALVLDFQQDGVVVDRPALDAAYAAACTAGHPVACAPLQWHGPEGLDRARARATFEAACAAGDPAACLVPGWLDSQLELGLSNVGAPAPTAAVTRFRGLCDQGLPRACAELGYLLRAGTGVAKDLPAARALLVRACEDGVGNACTSVAALEGEEPGAAGDPAVALRQFVRGCNRGDPISCHSAGLLLEGGADGAPDPGRARAYYDQACQGGLSSACMELALRGPSEALPALRERLHSLNEAGCAAGNDRACADLSEMLLAGWAKGDADLGRAEALRDRACAAHVAKACRAAADAVMQSRNPDFERVRGLLDQACRQDDGPACGRLGAMRLAMAEADPTATAEAITLTERACSLGHAQACVERGWMYLRGTGAPADPAAAERAWSSACERGASAGCTALAHGLVGGLHEGRPDLPSALPLFEQACQQDDPAACTALGQLHQRGIGVPYDMAAATALFQRACAAGDGLGCADLGWFVEVGLTGAPDLDTARRLYQQSCSLGSDKGCAHFAISASAAFVTSPEATEVLKRACLSRSATGCAGLARQELDHPRSREDQQGAIDLLETTCSLPTAMLCRWADCEIESPLACRWLGEVYWEGDGVRRSHKKARGYYERACHIGDPVACNRLSR